MRRRPILVMPPALALKIAAGEVVERPASAVKELIENALDAGASTIQIEVRAGGLRLIRVSDDGCGIPRTELPVAFTSHATSKIATLDELQSLTTLGFRGEALPSIAAVSRVEIQSRVPEDELGAEMELEYGKVAREGAIAMRPGTRIAVSDLFSNVPARRKFVRSERAETGRIQNVVMAYALAQPAVRFDLTIDGRLTFQGPGTGSVADALAAVYGVDILAETHPFERDVDGLTATGLLGAPAVNRPSRSAIHVAVNGRPVRNRSLVFALEEAYSGFLMTGRHPIAAARLQLRPDDVDSNIHPSKLEVRFAREREVHGVLHRAVADALMELRLRERSIGADGETVEMTTAEPAPLPLPDAPEPTQQVLMPAIPVLRVFGQTNQAFIVAEGPRGLYMIDQHAAHERILFDQLDEQIDHAAAPVQPLLEPALVELEPAQMAALEENRDLLNRAGLDLEPFGAGACLVRSIPALAARESPQELVHEVLEELQGLPEPSAARERALAAMACKGAVKAGQVLSVEEMRDLVTQLEHTPRPNTCPHGRPTMIHLSHMQLEREFGRR